MTRRAIAAGVLSLALFALVMGPAGAVIPGVGVISRKNMEWKFNYEQIAGSDIEFYETRSGSTVTRYAIVGDMGHGFSIYNITNPDLPTPAGQYVNPGFNWQGDIQINPKRKLAVLSIETPGATAHAPTGGIEIVDISNPLLPTFKGAVTTASGAAHNATIINDQYIYTLSPVYIIDYTDPAAPVNKGQAPSSICGGHDLTVDPNIPTRAYLACGSGTNTQIIDISNPAAPTLIKQISDTKIAISHQADPAPDSSFIVISDERGGGLGTGAPPQGGGHVWDISGKYVAGASLTTPKKMGIWFAPFYGATGNNTASSQWGNVTMHNFTFQAERYLMSTGWYTSGAFVADMKSATLASGGLYNEWQGNQNSNGGTTWGNTQGNILLEGDEVWSTKWTRFDDPLFDGYVFNSGLTRGFDVIKYTGPLPKKISRLAVNATAPGGTVSGKLDRYAVWTDQGNVNKPLAGKTLTVSVGGTSAQVTTGADGTFSAPLGLAAGTHSVTVSWPGDAAYDVASVTQSVTV